MAHSLNKRILSILSCFVIITLLPVVSNASLIGDEIFVEITDASNPPAVTIGPVLVDNTLELPSIVIDIPGLGPVDLGSLDVMDSSFTVEFSLGGVPQQFIPFDFASGDSMRLYDLDWRDTNGDLIPGKIVGVAIGSTNIGGLSDTALNFGDHEVTVDFTGVSVDTDSYFTVDIKAAHEGANPVPEPSTYALMGLGVSAMLAWKRRQKKAMTTAQGKNSNLQ